MEQEHEFFGSQTTLADVYVHSAPRTPEPQSPIAQPYHTPTMPDESPITPTQPVPTAEVPGAPYHSQYEAQLPTNEEFLLPPRTLLSEFDEADSQLPVLNEIVNIEDEETDDELDESEKPALDEILDGDDQGIKNTVRGVLDGHVGTKQRQCLQYIFNGVFAMYEEAKERNAQLERRIDELEERVESEKILTGEEKRKRKKAEKTLDELAHRFVKEDFEFKKELEHYQKCFSDFEQSVKRRKLNDQ